MIPIKNKKESLIGVTTVGEKGQIVIPADIRMALKLGKGTKLIAIAHEGGLAIMRPAALEGLASRFSALQTFIKKTK